MKSSRAAPAGAGGGHHPACASTLAARTPGVCAHGQCPRDSAQPLWNGACLPACLNFLDKPQMLRSGSQRSEVKG